MSALPPLPSLPQALTPPLLPTPAPGSPSPSPLAWRFLPQPQAPDQRAGIAVTPRGSIALADEAASLRQSILLLVATRPGERVKRPDYGCHLFRLAFAPNDDTTAGLAIHYVRQALERWEPRVRVLRLDATRPHADAGRLELQLVYQRERRTGAETLSLSFDLFSGQVR